MGNPMEAPESPMSPQKGMLGSGMQLGCSVGLVPGEGSHHHWESPCYRQLEGSSFAKGVVIGYWAPGRLDSVFPRFAAAGEHQLLYIW